MNHILLPDAPDDLSGISGVGVNAMELLINAIIKQGGQKRRLRARVFGGGKMTSHFSEVGKKILSLSWDF